jgi:3-hydroxyacyl-CoA dehydrogenase/enoyl-CoA hydratase/3-hydroxybutyryl-CoA epimerase
MATEYVSWRAEDSIAIVTIDCPEAKVNTLDEKLLHALEKTAKELFIQEEIDAIVVVSGKPKGFIAGADINIIENVTDQKTAENMARRGQEVFQLWADIKQPVVAAINGHCLGGGLEFALACDARLGAPDAQLGLPEVKLGILPGFGGTQRMPRIVGLTKALELILAGRILPAEKALQAGLLDKVTDQTNLCEQAINFARTYKTGVTRNQPGGWKRWLLECNPLGRSLLFNKSSEMLARQTKGHYPAPVKALAVMRKTYSMPLQEGLSIEAQALGELAISKESKNLVHIYNLSQRAKHNPVPDIKPVEIASTAVLGAGVMGSGIAWLLARKGLNVLLKDISETAVASGLQRIRSWAEKRNSNANQAAFMRIKGEIKDESFSEVDLVIEAVQENMDVKKLVLQQTEQWLSSSAIFASNTSSLSITEMQNTSKRPEQVVGLHFFNPVELMPLVEIIRGKRTSDQTIATTFNLTNKLGKTPILVADSPGFLVNRLLVVYLNEACLLVDEGVDWQSIDKMAVDFGMPMGPFRLIDEVGIDIANEVGKILCRAFPYLQESPLLQKIESAGYLGKKQKQGFYRYQEKNKPRENQNIAKILAETKREASNEDWQRLTMLMIAEASRCLEEEIVARAEDIDTGMVFGTGFPPFRGGLCRWADQLPYEEKQTAVNKFPARYGERFNVSTKYRNTLSFY